MAGSIPFQWGFRATEGMIPQDQKSKLHQWHIDHPPPCSPSPALPHWRLCVMRVMGLIGEDPQAHLMAPILLTGCHDNPAVWGFLVDRESNKDLMNRPRLFLVPCRCRVATVTAILQADTKRSHPCSQEGGMLEFWVAAGNLGSTCSKCISA